MRWCAPACWRCCASTAEQLSPNLAGTPSSRNAAQRQTSSSAPCPRPHPQDPPAPRPPTSLPRPHILCTARFCLGGGLARVRCAPLPSPAPLFRYIRCEKKLALEQSRRQLSATHLPISMPAAPPWPLSHDTFHWAREAAHVCRPPPLSSSSDLQIDLISPPFFSRPPRIASVCSRPPGRQLEAWARPFFRTAHPRPSGAALMQRGPSVLPDPRPPTPQPGAVPAAVLGSYPCSCLAALADGRLAPPVPCAGPPDRILLVPRALALGGAPRAPCTLASARLARAM
jgi:hypothetical protein